MTMQTFDLVAAGPRTVDLWRGSRHRKLLLLASLAAVALGVGAWLTHPPTDSPSAAAPKLEGRIAVAPQRAPTEDEARLAAYQQAVALSFVKPLAAAAPEADSLADSAAAKPAHPRGRVAPMAAKRDGLAAAPLPPPRPTTPVAIAAAAPPVAPPPVAAPQVIFADLPAAPPPAADPGYFDASLQAMAGVGRGVARVPGATRDLAAATVDRLGGTLFAVGARLGL